MILMSGVYFSLNSSTLEHDQEHLLELRMESFYIFLELFFIWLLWEFMNRHVAIVSQCLLVLLPHGMCPAREQMGLCTTAHAKYKSLKAVLTAQLTPPAQWTCVFEPYSVHNPKANPWPY